MNKKMVISSLDDLRLARPEFKTGRMEVAPGVEMIFRELSVSELTELGARGQASSYVELKVDEDTGESSLKSSGPDIPSTHWLPLLAAVNEEGAPLFPDLEGMTEEDPAVKALDGWPMDTLNNIARLVMRISGVDMDEEKNG